MKNSRIRTYVELGAVPPGCTARDIIDGLAATKKPNVLEAHGILSAVRVRGGKALDLGVVSVQKVTQAFTQYLVDSMQNSTTAPMDVFKYHGSGTGSGAEANTETALVTEVGTRATGTTIEGATANIYKSVATTTYAASYAIIEHGIFSAASAGTMLDRSVISVVNVINLDRIIWTYQLTVNAET